MYPRGRIDIGWKDLLFGLRSSFRTDPPELLESRIEEWWQPGATVVTLSVRSGFDALLRALDFPSGSEVLVSAITIRDMTRIIEAHGLVPVPVDLDMDRLAVDEDAVRNAITSRTKAILIAHIFGSRMPLEAIGAVTHEHRLLLIEDCAQAYADPSDRGDPAADVSMFSFGPIKTNTALAGGILTIRSPELLDRTRAILSGYERQAAVEFRKRLVKYMGIKTLSSPLTFGLFARGCRLAGHSHDVVISHALRGFPGPDLLTKIRRRPSAPLLALIHRRISTFDVASIQQREAAANTALALLRGVGVPGRRAAKHTHWVTPIYVDDPDAVMHQLWAAGFDATRGASSLAVVEPPAERRDTEPVEARRVMNGLLYLPVSPGMPKRALTRLADITNDAVANRLGHARGRLADRSSVPAR